MGSRSACHGRREDGREREGECSLSLPTCGTCGWGMPRPDEHRGGPNGGAGSQAGTASVKGAHVQAGTYGACREPGRRIESLLSADMPILSACHVRIQALVSVVEEKADLETQVVVLQEKVRMRRGWTADVCEYQTRADMQPKAPNHVPPTLACLMAHPMFC